MKFESADKARALGATCRLLARVWLREVDQAFAEELEREPVKESFESVGGVIPDFNSPETLTDLAVDYCRLFIGPKGHIPPFQSAWEGDQLQGEAAESMANYIDIIGYARTCLPGGLMLDHFAVQLDVLGYVVESNAQATIESHETTELIEAYIATHVRWTEELLGAATRRATSDFYRAAAGMTRSLIAMID